MEQQQHIPVLMHEAISALAIKPDGVYLDATFGRGGHTEQLLQRLGERGRVFALDRDESAQQHAHSQYADESRFTFLRTSFAEMRKALTSSCSDIRLDGVLMDLGVSSPQLDSPERGFSFMRKGALDMRMDTSQGESAAQWLERVEEVDLVAVLFEYGEEKYARKIARAIIDSRQKAPISNTLQLAEIVAASVPKKDKHKHPATRTFQAIRIFVNQELAQIEQALPQAVSLLKPEGRLVIISFHSLEDRIVKRFLRKHSSPKLPPKNIPVVSEDAYKTPLKLIGKAIKPSKEEVASNPRSRSSVMRVAQRTQFFIRDNPLLLEV